MRRMNKEHDIQGVWKFYFFWDLAKVDEKVKSFWSKTLKKCVFRTPEKYFFNNPFSFFHFHGDFQDFLGMLIKTIFRKEFISAIFEISDN